MQPLYAAYQRRDLQAVVSLGSILVKRFPDATPLLNLLGAACVPFQITVASPSS
jgi:hypothetical protein